MNILEKFKKISEEDKNVFVLGNLYKKATDLLKEINNFEKEKDDEISL